MPDWLLTIVLGIVEGITEFLPVSSTGHLLITDHLLKVPEYLKSDLFNIVIQSGAVLAVIPLFRARFDQFIHRWKEPATQGYMLKILVAFFITGVGGYLLEKKHFKLPEELKPVAIALLVGGILFVVVEYMLRGKKLGSDVAWSVAIAVGLGQLVAAIFPGASRSGTTILLSLLLGLSRPAATEFSFLVGIPTMLAAGCLKIFHAVHHPDALAPKEHWDLVLLATVVSAVVSFVAVKWLLRYVQSHTFNAFGWYRIAMGVAILALLMR